MSVTLALLSRNSEARIGAAIRSAADLVDDVIVLDTGSTDGTVEIARSEGARVFRTEWPGAFDVACNLLLDLVKTDWLFRLDSDEELREESRDPFRSFLADPGETEVVFVVRRDHEPGGLTSYCRLPRLWRHRPDRRYDGAVHEQLDRDRMAAMLEDGRAITRPDLLLDHWGFVDIGDRRIKDARNLPLIEEELRRRPHDFYYQVCRVDILRALGDDRWRPLVRKLVDRVLSRSNVPPEGMEPILFRVYFEELTPSQRGDARARAIREYVLRWLRADPVALWVTAVNWTMAGEPALALDPLLTLEAMGEGRAPIAAGAAYTDRAIGVDCWRLLAPVAAAVRDAATYRRVVAKLERLAPSDDTSHFH